MRQKMLMSKRSFLRNAHNTEQTPFTRVHPSGTHFTAESTEAMHIKRSAHGYDILMEPRCEPSNAESKNRHLTDMTSELKINSRAK